MDPINFEWDNDVIYAAQKLLILTELQECWNLPRDQSVRALELFVSFLGSSGVGHRAQEQTLQELRDCINKSNLPDYLSKHIQLARETLRHRANQTYP